MTHTADDLRTSPSPAGQRELPTALAGMLAIGGHILAFGIVALAALLAATAAALVFGSALLNLA